MIRHSTDGYPEAERLEGWREEFASLVLRLNIQRLDDPERDPFHASVEVSRLGGILFTNFVGTPIRFSRDRKLASDGDDDFTFLINRSGSIKAWQNNSEAVNTTPNIVMVDNGRPLDVQVNQDNSTLPERRVEGGTFGFALPRRALLAVAPDAESWIAKPLGANPAILEYLSLYTRELVVNNNQAVHPSLAGTMGVHIFDMIAMLVGPSKDTLEIAGRRGLRAARLRAIIAYVERNLSDPRIGAETIAEHFRISSRYVSRLMEEHGETLSSFVLRRRIVKVAAMLLDSANRSMRISDIAYACGFSDLSYFNRSFKRQFGISPRLFRA